MNSQSVIIHSKEVQLKLKISVNWINLLLFPMHSHFHHFLSHFTQQVEEKFTIYEPSHFDFVNWIGHSLQDVELEFELEWQEEEFTKLQFKEIRHSHSTEEFQ